MLLMELEITLLPRFCAGMAELGSGFGPSPAPTHYTYTSLSRAVLAAQSYVVEATMWSVI